MHTEEVFQKILVSISEEIELRIEEDRSEGFDAVLKSLFKKSDQQKAVRNFSEAQKEALLRLTHALLVIGEYGDELEKQTPDQDIDAVVDELYDYCYAQLILPPEMILEPVAEIVETLYAE